jgi:hypothetical protein
MFGLDKSVCYGCVFKSKNNVVDCKSLIKCKHINIINIYWLMSKEAVKTIELLKVPKVFNYDEWSCLIRLWNARWHPHLSDINLHKRSIILSILSEYPQLDINDIDVKKTIMKMRMVYGRPSVCITITETHGPMTLFYDINKYQKNSELNYTLNIKIYHQSP